MSAARPLGLLGRYVEGAAATLVRPSDIEVGTVAASRIAMASTVAVATTAGGFREATLDHGRGGAKQLAEQFLPTHINILVTLCAAVKKKSTVWHGIHRALCENRGSERCILRQKVAMTPLGGRSRKNLLAELW